VYFDRKEEAVASTRFSTTQRSGAPAQTPRQALTSLARHGVRVHVEAGTAASRRLARWANAADRLVQAAGDELLRRVGGESGSPKLVTSSRATRTRQSTTRR